MTKVLYKNKEYNITSISLENKYWDFLKKIGESPTDIVKGYLAQQMRISDKTQKELKDLSLKARQVYIMANMVVAKFKGTEYENWAFGLLNEVQMIQAEQEKQNVLEQVV